MISHFSTDLSLIYPLSMQSLKPALVGHVTYRFWITSTYCIRRLYVITHIATMHMFYCRMASFYFSLKNSTKHCAWSVEAAKENGHCRHCRLSSAQVMSHRNDVVVERSSEAHKTNGKLIRCACRGDLFVRLLRC